MSRVLRYITLSLCALALCGSAAAGAVAHAGSRVLRYRGVELHVPAGWPVFHLSSASRTCVRFNRHAIYLGTPGSDQRCPAFSIGHTEALLVEPAASAGTSAPTANSVAPSVQLRQTLPAQGVVISASWGRDPAAIARVLGRAHVSAPSGAADTAPPAPTGTVSAPGSTVSRLALRAAPRTARAASATFTGAGFDACTAPSARTMARWARSPFRAVGVYLGGVNSACAQPNLTAAWVQAQVSAGWHLILTYVGLQAPRNSCGCAAIAASRAAQEGRASALDAVARATALGIGPGASIYFDMEAYPSTSRTRPVVLSFLGAWTRALHARGYQSGVYSSINSGVGDLVGRLGTSFAEPDSVWFADWNGEPNVAAPYIPLGAWPGHQLLHQYRGDHQASYGGVALDIDSDYLTAGATASVTALTGSLPGLSIATPPAASSPASAPPAGPPTATPTPATPAPATPTPATPTTPATPAAPANPTPATRLHDGMLVEVAGTGAVYRLAGGAPLFVRYWNDIGGPQTPTIVSQHQFGELASAPADGTLLATITGATYVIAGGYPFALSPSDVPPRSHPILIDAWDLLSLGNPITHLNATPADGTVVEGVPSGTTWVFQTGVLTPTAPSRRSVLAPDGLLRGWPSTVRR